MSSVNIELVGGPMDGQHLEFDDSMLSWHNPKMPPFIALTGDNLLGGGAVDPGLGRYALTRKMTRAGRLIYEFRASTVEASR